MSVDGLLGLTKELDDTVHDLGFLALQHGEMHPANTGDVSQVLSKETALQVESQFGGGASEWFSLRELPRLAEIRGDGRTGYRAEGIADEEFFKQVSRLDGRVMVITRTGSSLPSIAHTIARGCPGLLLNIIEIGKGGESIRILLWKPTIRIDSLN